MSKKEKPAVPGPEEQPTQGGSGATPDEFKTAVTVTGGDAVAPEFKTAATMAGGGETEFKTAVTTGGGEAPEIPEKSAAETVAKPAAGEAPETPEAETEKKSATAEQSAGAAGAMETEERKTSTTAQDGGKTTAKTGRAAGHIFADGEKVGKYIIEKRLGKGGMGEVYLAMHETLGVRRAIKVLPREIAEKNSQFLARFIREAKTACEIRHSNIVNVMDVDTDPERGVPYIVMEYVDGGDVRGLLKASGRLTLDQSLVIVEAVASALAAAAEFGIVHRDIKPDNIMLTKRGDVKLADLGIAKSGDDDVQLTRTNVMMGTPAYLSPEQAHDAKHVDVRADIYSLGATFFELLTGRIPHPGESAYDILAKLFSEPPPNPCDYNPEVPPEIGKIVVTMLAKEPEKRYQSADELLKVLSACRKKQHTVAEAQKLIRDAIATAFGTEAAAYPAVHGRRRRRRAVWKFAAAAAVLALAGGALWYAFRHPAARHAVSHPAARHAVSRPALPPGAAPKPLYRAGFRVSPGAAVTVKNRSGAEMPAASQSGNLILFELPDGVYLYTVAKDGCRSVDGLLELHAHAAVKKIALAPAVFTVRSEPGAAIELARDGKRIASGVADDKGIFSVSGLTAGRYVVGASLSGRIARKEELTLAGNVDIQHVFRLDPLVKTVKKYRLNFTTAPADAAVTVRDGKGREFKSVSRLGSVCTFELPKGFYVYSVRRSGYRAREGRLGLDRDCDLGEIALTPFTLTVTALPGTSLELISGSHAVERGTADKDGKRVFRGVPGGKYVLRGALDGYVIAREEFEVAEAKDTALVLKQAPEEWKVRFAALPGTSGTLFRNGQQFKRLTFRRRSELLKLPAGEYRLELALADHRAKTAVFAVPDDLQVNAVMDKNVFTLQVVPVPGGVRAELRREDGSASPRVVHIRRNGVFAGLAAGNYLLELSRDGYQTYRESFTIAGDETRNIVLKKVPARGADNGGIVLRSVKSNSPDLEKHIVQQGVEIKLKGYDSSWRRVKFPYTIGDLAPGRYTVIFRAPEKHIKGQESDEILVERGKFASYTMMMITF